MVDADHAIAPDVGDGLALYPHLVVGIIGHQPAELAAQRAVAAPHPFRRPRQAQPHPAAMTASPDPAPVVIRPPDPPWRLLSSITAPIGDGLLSIPWTLTRGLRLRRLLFVSAPPRETYSLRSRSLVEESSAKTAGNDQRTLPAPSRSFRSRI